MCSLIYPYISNQMNTRLLIFTEYSVCFEMPSFILSLLLFLCFSSTAVMSSDTDYFIRCGVPESTPILQEGNKIWQSDENQTFAPADINEGSSVSVAKGAVHAPYGNARIFKSPVTYTFSISPGPKFLRLYFTTTTSYNYNNSVIIPASEFFLTVEANGYTLLQNFSAFFNSNVTTQINEGIWYEFQLTVQKDKPLNVTFSPPSTCPTTTTTCFGFVNGIEIITIPDGLYFNDTRNPPPLYISMSGNNPYSFQQDKVAFQTAYRLNVGGSHIGSVNDSGTLYRDWYNDRSYIVGNIIGKTFYPPNVFQPIGSVIQYKQFPTYVAPREVYATARIMSLPFPQGLSNNLTWKFDVDPGFSYLLRLHFCELNVNVTGVQQKVFQVFINSMSADEVDVFYIAGNIGIPVFRDYVVDLNYASSGGTKVPLWLTLQPKDEHSHIVIADMLLNGLEILKLNQWNGNLAVPNPPSSPVPSPSPIQNPKPGNNWNHLLPIIGGILGAILVSAFVCFMIYRKRKTNQKIINTMPIEDSSKLKWVIPFDESGSTATTANPSVASSLPSHLCQHFSLAQIKLATCDFDDDLIIGRGGFGKVYKGTIDDGTTTVAIKRLNPTSNQGAREFLTEIEMLSRLRHVHLVSLIGYCDDYDEMILVYEYMSQGTLRDHLLYKNPQIVFTPLLWKQRLKICVGAARGLQYLHAGAKELIIHRDVKSTNILLDDKWTAKVSDFGLSKVGPTPGEAGATYVSTAVKGSAGYLDPEYYRRHQLTEKSDVYSFGVVLFEVLCARPAVNPNLSREQANLAMWARSHYKRGTLHNIVDPNLSGQIASESLRKFGEIAEMCVRDRGSERPSMGDVVWGLEFSLQLQETAEKNNTSGATEDEILDQSSNINISGGDGGTTDNEVFSDAAMKRFLDSKSTTSTSSEYTVDHMKSCSVFSEIIDPTAR